MSKKTYFAEELKLASKWTNILNERKNYNREDDDDESLQTTRKPYRNISKKVNIKSPKQIPLRNE